MVVNKHIIRKGLYACKLELVVIEIDAPLHIKNSKVLGSREVYSYGFSDINCTKVICRAIVGFGCDVESACGLLGCGLYGCFGCCGIFNSTFFGNGDCELSAFLGAEVKFAEVENCLNGLRFILGIECDVVTVINCVGSYSAVLERAAEVVRPSAVDSKLDLTVEAFADVVELDFPNIF